MSSTKQRLPEIGEYVKGEGTLVAVQEIVLPPPPVNKDYIFEEITARVEVRLGVEVLNKVCTLWDAYGLESSVEGAIEEAKQYAAKRGIGPGSELEVVVIKRAEQVRKRPWREGENPYDKDFIRLEQLQVGSRSNLPDPVETVAWSSREEPK